MPTNTKKGERTIWLCAAALGVLILIWQLYLPHIFNRTCWLSQAQYEQTIHMVAMGGPGGTLDQVATTSLANIYYCARFGAVSRPDSLPMTFPEIPAPLEVPPPR